MSNLSDLEIINKFFLTLNEMGILNNNVALDELHIRILEERYGSNPLMKEKITELLKKLNKSS
jgi:hypothetical protein